MGEKERSIFSFNLEGVKNSIILEYLQKIEIPADKYKKSIVSNIIPFVSPNNIAVCRDGTIYVSNFNLRLSPQSSSNSVKIYTQKEDTASISYSDTIISNRGADWHIVASHLGGANGLAISDDERYLYVSGYYQRCVWQFERHSQTGDLINPKQIKLDAHPDNLTFDNNHLYITAQESLRSTTSYLLNARFIGKPNIFSSKSKIFKYQVGSKSKSADLITELKVPSGYNAASTCVKCGDSYYLSQIIDDQIVEIKG